MSWVRIDDQFPDHPKVSAAGPIASWLHICGICYCNRLLTDGFIPTQVAHRLADFSGVGIGLGTFGDMAAIGDDASCEWMAKRLCDVGLWRRVKGGYRIHDYLDYQPSKASVQAEKEAARARMSKVRRSPNVRANFAGTSAEVQLLHPNPIPYSFSYRSLPTESSNEGLESHDPGTGKGTPLERLHTLCGGTTEALTKLKRAARRKPEATIIAALENASGPDVRDRLAVALATLSGKIKPVHS